MEMNTYVYHVEIFTEAQERNFLAWIRTLTSVLSRREPCQACHIRRVSQGAGTGRKPRLMSVPMTAEEHQMQSTQSYHNAIQECGSYAVLQNFAASGLTAIEWFEQRALNYRSLFLSQSLRNAAKTTTNQSV